MECSIHSRDRTTKYMLRTASNSINGILVYTSRPTARYNRSHHWVHQQNQARRKPTRCISTTMYNRYMEHSRHTLAHKHRSCVDGIQGTCYRRNTRTRTVAAGISRRVGNQRRCAIHSTKHHSF